jgi:hypothetical protein
MSSAGKGFDPKVHKSSQSTITLGDPSSPIHGIRENVSAMTRLEALSYLNSRISALRQDPGLFGEAAEDKIVLMALSVVIGEVRDRE